VFDFHALGMAGNYKIQFHEYLPEGMAPFDASASELTDEVAGVERAYVQGSLHCSELPGMLVSYHLVKLLDAAALQGRIRKPITVVPYANPIGLQQIFLGFHFGRFSMSTGVNFNRSWPDLTNEIMSNDAVLNQLKPSDDLHNTIVLRKALYAALCQDWNVNNVERLLKREIYKRAGISSIVLDLHCDMEAVLHMYTHDRLWPQMQDLADSLDSQCNMICADSGGNAFDESCSNFWNKMQELLVKKSHPAATTGAGLPMACQSATIELRGQSDVYDELASADAANLFAFFVRRGFIAQDESNPVPALMVPSPSIATPLTGLDFIEAPVPGVIAWKVCKGTHVVKGQLLCEIVNIEDHTAPRERIEARCDGFVYGMELHKLAIPGEIIVYVAGKEPLEWRKGYLLTAK
jgi:hypothetical protein